MSPSPLLFLDSDLFVLHAGAGLLPALIQATGSNLNRARRLHPLPYMLQKGALAARYPQGLRERAAAWCSRITAVEDAPSPGSLEPLLGVAAIEPGEALLFALAAETPRSLMATGDRRACCALAAASGLAEIRALLRHKLICLESALALLLREVGFPHLAAALTLVRDYNQTLRVLLPQGELTDEGAFREGLASYLRDVSALTGDLLLPVTVE